jgi:LmbE family N-acetylglucosaminyl deacetylase
MNPIRLLFACVLVVLPLASVLPAQAQEGDGPVLVITAGPRDYIFGAGGTLAQMIGQGREVYVLQFGNLEKDSAGSGPAQTSLVSNAEARTAAELLGVKEVLNLGHKSGELAYISSSEMRNQVMTMVRFYKPETMFFPDWYVHYVDDQDIYRVGRMAEESPYGGGNYFLQEMTHIGLTGYAAKFYYFYAPYRPYRPGEGGEGHASFKAVDITSTFDRKIRSALALRTPNQRYATETKQRLEIAGRPTPLLNPLDDLAVDKLIRAYLEELASTIGAKHGHRYAEEFNFLGSNPPIPAHVLERARPIQSKR